MNNAADTDLPLPAMPEGWTVEYRSAAGICTVTLADEHGEQKEIEFCTTQPAAGYLLARSLEQIRDPELRAAAEAVLRRHHGRVATAQAACDAFKAALPPGLRRDLSVHLRRILGSSSTLSLDPDTLTPVLTLTADGPQSGQLLARVRTWQSDGNARNDDAQVTLDEHSGTLTVVLVHFAAADFLTYLSRTDPHAALLPATVARAGWARRALEAYDQAAIRAGALTAGPEPGRDSIANLIAALLHLGDRHTQQHSAYEDLLSHARHRYEEQVRPADDHDQG